MIAFPPSKINLGLFVCEKRNDGYHNIDSVFYPLPVHDILEIVLSPTDETKLFIYGLSIEGDVEENLVMKAYRFMQKKYQLAPIHIHLFKKIPSGAGLGGGSADATYMIHLLNTFFNIGLETKEIADIAIQLGSDCAFFAYKQPMYVQGRGEILHEVSVDLKSYHIILMNPGIHVSTKEAYSNIHAQMPSISSKEWISKAVSEWKNGLSNDFEKSVFLLHPNIELLKNYMYAQGAVYAAMSGSGSSVYGLFDKAVDTQDWDQKFKEMIIINQSLS